MSDRSLRLLLVAGGAIGGAVAAYLTVVHYRGGALVCVTGGCETVQRSRYAELFGIPVAALGLAAYAALVASALTRRPTAVAVGAGVALTGVLFSTYLVLVQVAVIDAICVWCVVADTLMALVGTVAVLRLVRVLE